MSDYDKWLQEVMHHMMMSKLNEANGIKHESGQTLFRVMRANDIHLQSMYECGVESYDVPDRIREPGSMFVSPRT